MKITFHKNLLGRRQKRVVAVCDTCGRDYVPEQNIDDQPDPKPGVTQYGLRCPHCGAFVLSYRSTRQLEQLRKRVKEAAEAFRAVKTKQASERYDQLKAQLQEAHDRLNPKEGRQPTTAAHE